MFVFFFGGGGGSEPVRLEEKSALNFFLDLAWGWAQQRAPRRPRQCDPRLRHQQAAASRGRDPPGWSWVKTKDSSLSLWCWHADRVRRSTPAYLYRCTVKQWRAIRAYTVQSERGFAYWAFYLVSCRFSDRWRGRFKQPSRGRPSRPSRSMENRRWGLEIRPCTVSLSTPSVESARELASSLSARRRTSGGRCARIPLTWGGASTS